LRKLASIQKIRALTPIEGADAIEMATVLGWQLVVKKGEFQAGGLCVYCEIDSILPARPEFEFLKPRGMRIKTIRLRGQISQGICFPLSILPEGSPIEEGADVTEILGIAKWEMPIPDIPVLVAMATRRSSISPDVWSEGIVIRPLEEQSFEGGRVSFKVINPEFLLKFGE